MPNTRNAGRPPCRLILRRGDTITLNGTRFTLKLEGRQWKLVTQKIPADPRWNVLLAVVRSPLEDKAR